MAARDRPTTVTRPTTPGGTAKDRPATATPPTAPAIAARDRAAPGRKGTTPGTAPPSPLEPGTSPTTPGMAALDCSAPGTDATVLDLELPEYQLVNLSAGIDFDSGLSLIVYANNLLDENPLLSFDRERGGRARLGYSVGQPRTIGVTVRQSF